MSDIDFYLNNGLVVTSNATVGGSIVMDSIRTSVVSNVTVDTSSSVVDSVPINVVRSARYFVQAVCDIGYQTSWILMVHDGVKSYHTEYAIISSVGTPLINFSTDITNGSVRLLGEANFTTSSVWFQKTAVETAGID